MPQSTRLAVHQALRGDDAPAERLCDRLVSKADAEERNLSGELAYRRERHAGRVGIARPGREQNRLRRERGDSRDVDFVVSHDLDVRAERFDHGIQFRHLIAGKRLGGKQIQRACGGVV